MIKMQLLNHELIKCDALVIGSGGAGLRTAIELHDLKVNVLVVGKCEKGNAHTILATGGINAALANMDKKDSWQLHAADTIRDGCFLNDPQAVKILCKNAPLAIKELIKWNARFARDKNGKILQRFFGAATFRRACFAGDHTGKEILKTLLRQTEKRKILFKSNVYIFSLLGTKNKINGAMGIDKKNGKIIVFHCRAIVLATGGHSRIFSRSSSRFWENNADGIFLAWQKGTKFSDMEMFQFHPTGMVWPKKTQGLLVTEAVRGEGGILTNAKKERFMQKYDSKRMELSARDIVARAIYLEIQAGNGTQNNGVWLDISFKPKKFILKRLPTMFKQFKQYAGIDISRQKMEVAPTAHYSMGGIKTNHLNGKTSIQGLFAVGEVTSGIHGANRLGGNSLAEIMVFGKLIGQSIAKELKKTKWLKLGLQELKEKKTRLQKMLSNKKGKNPIQAKKEFQAMMWEHAGVARNEKNLKKGLQKLEKLKKTKLAINDSLKNNQKLIAALDFQNMIPASEMILKSALKRKESRGAHYRTDYPKTNTAWKKNIECTPTKKGLKLKTTPIKPIPPEIKKFLNQNTSIKQKLLE